jgi:hypothetical protein
MIDTKRSLRVFVTLIPITEIPVLALMLIIEEF